MPAEEVSPAIVLRTRDYAESDRIVTLLTRDSGKLAGIAKGAKQSRRRFERKLEVFSHVMVYYRRRPQGELVFITRAEAAALPAFDLTDDLGKIGLGSYLVELTDALSREQGDSAGAYEVLAAAMLALTRLGPSPALRQAFELQLLRWAGYQLEFTRCRLCAAKPGPQVKSFGFMVSHGGIVCQACRVGADNEAINLDAASVAALSRLGSMPLAEVGQAQWASPQAQAAIGRFISPLLERKLRSLSFLEQVL
ncbi:MAG TPA: DNA repair protein RecO [Candidatus Binataceae bacterium]|nr:DNA repair protein RecO [Candidatus Binataceae bacterium]